MELIIDKPFALVTPKVKITWPNGWPVGAIQCHFGLKPRFTLLDPQDRQIGEIRGDFFAWDFTITDWRGVEVARVNEQWEGLAAAWFTTADRYAVQIPYQLPDPLRTLVILRLCRVEYPRPHACWSTRGSALTVRSGSAEDESYRPRSGAV